MDPMNESQSVSQQEFLRRGLWAAVTMLVIIPAQIIVFVSFAPSRNGAGVA
jgi:hypothetical protein